MAIKSNFAAISAKPSKIVTKAELLQRIRNRAVLKQQQHYTPNNGRSAYIKQQDDGLNENRITYLQKNLGKVRAKAMSNHRLSTMKGLTKTSFNNSKNKGKGWG